MTCAAHVLQPGCASCPGRVETMPEVRRRRERRRAGRWPAWRPGTAVGTFVGPDGQWTDRPALPSRSRSARTAATRIARRRRTTAGSLTWLRASLFRPGPAPPGGGPRQPPGRVPWTGDGLGAIEGADFTAPPPDGHTWFLWGTAQRPASLDGRRSPAPIGLDPDVVRRNRGQRGYRGSHRGV